MVLDVVSGPATGRSFRCGADQETTFGRTDAASNDLPEDFYLSRQHFCILYDDADQCWRVRDLESRHGTYLDGERVEEGVLTPGAEVTAGKSVFVVQSIPLSPVETAVAVAAGGALFAAVAASDRSPTKAPKYQRLKCGSGLVSLIGTESDPNSAHVAWLLARETPLFLVADFSKVSKPLPTQVEEVDYLFNWMDEQVLPFCSPVLLGPDDPIDPYEVIDEFWDEAALLCIFSDLEKDELMLRLRAAIRQDDGSSNDVPNGMMGYCWPEAARAVLESAPEKLTAPLMQCGWSVFLEAEEADRWQVFCQRDDERRVRAALEI